MQLMTSWNITCNCYWGEAWPGLFFSHHLGIVRSPEELPQLFLLQRKMWGMNRFPLLALELPCP